MNHKGTVQLETQRLILRQFRQGDAGAMYRNWCSDDEVTRYLTWPSHPDEAASERCLARWIADYGHPNFYNWAIELKELGQPIGNISVVEIREMAESLDLGYCMGRAYWGIGIMPEAGKAVLKFLFEEVGANRVAAAHAAVNPKSGRVMQKLGMTYDGTLRAAGYCNAGVVDEVWYSILRSEYLNNK